MSLLSSKPDLVHVHGVWQWHCLATWIWSLITGKTYVVTPHGMLEPWILRRSPRLKSIIAKLYQNRFLKGAAGFHLLTPKEQLDIAEFESGQPSAVIPNYVPIVERDDVKPAWWSTEFDGIDVYLFLGRIHEKKGCLEICRAWEALCAANTEFASKSAFVFCGWVDGLSQFEPDVKSLGQKFGNIHFAGPQYGIEKIRSLSAARYLVLPSKSEGLPMAVLESWSVGTPVIMSPECNLQVGYDRGIAFRTGHTAKDVEASLLAASLRTQHDWEQASRLSIDVVRQLFSVENLRDDLLDLYRRAIRFKQQGRK